MSELQLSAQLVKDMQAVLLQHDEGAADPGVTSQYLCAVVGFLLGQQDMPLAQKHSYLDELTAFMKHVTEDIDKQQEQQSPAAAHPSSSQEAFGIWKPKK